MSNLPHSDLGDIWRLGNEPDIRCCACLQMISGEAMIRTFRVLPSGKEQQHKTRILRTPDDHELTLYDRHLSCLLKGNIQYATVSHVWHEGISEIQNQEYFGFDSPDLQRLVFRIPTEIAQNICKALGQDIEVWHDYISVPQVRCTSYLMVRVDCRLQHKSVRGNIQPAHTRRDRRFF